MAAGLLAGRSKPVTLAGPIIAAILADSPTGYWPCNETTGTTVADYSGNGNTSNAKGSGVVLGAREAPCSGMVPSFPGAGATHAELMIEIPDAAGYSASGGLLTVEALCYLDVASAGIDIAVSKGSGSNNYEWHMGILASTKACAAMLTSAGGEALTASGADGNVTTGTWFHLAMRYTSATPRCEVFINGVSIASDQTLTGTVDVDGTSKIAIGYRSDFPGATNSFDGNIGQVAIFQQYLSDARILAHANACRGL